MTVLITGAAGYIGSVTVEVLTAAGQSVVALDNLTRGHREAVASGVPFYRGELTDAQLVRDIVHRHRVDACIHFAGFAYVAESVYDPGSYFENNVAAGIRLIRVLSAAGIRRFVFSSSCATYGEACSLPISEEHPQSPTSPYGWSKFTFERVLEAFDRAHEFRFVAFRYFNAGGATKTHGEHHEPETHLIPNVIAAALGRRSSVTVYGNDFNTPDGTAIRDYIHVTDLALAHSAALEYLRSGGPSRFINLGTGAGYSVLEIIRFIERITRKSVPVSLRPRRAGDPPVLVAAFERARSVLGWKPESSKLDDIITSAWRWHVAHPFGYSNEPVRKA